ncbi:hypothetical protein R1flu_000823 [Riccia fluitans]|uniref:Uncharacterized protein n=1 Tax=Riccia fluitans TaxID=41844 RepID=A0ABD1Y1L1_9MARC
MLGVDGLGLWPRRLLDQGRMQLTQMWRLYRLQFFHVICDSGDRLILVSCGKRLSLRRYPSCLADCSHQFSWVLSGRGSDENLSYTQKGPVKCDGTLKGHCSLATQLVRSAEAAWDLRWKTLPERIDYYEAIPRSSSSILLDSLQCQLVTLRFGNLETTQATLKQGNTLPAAEEQGP